MEEEWQKFRRDLKQMRAAMEEEEHDFEDSIYDQSDLPL
jgi:hypothetical protein